MINREPSYHSSNYFCMRSPIGKGLSKKKISQCSIQTLHLLMMEKDNLFLMYQLFPPESNEEESEDDEENVEFCLKPSISYDL